MLAARHRALGAVGRALLRPGGRLFIREGHPMLWALDDDRDPTACSSLEYPYFEHAEPMVCDEPGTYVQTDAPFEHNVTHSGTTASARSSPRCWTPACS